MNLFTFSAALTTGCAHVKCDGSLFRGFSFRTNQMSSGFFLSTEINIDLHFKVKLCIILSFILLSFYLQSLFFLGVHYEIYVLFTVFDPAVEAGPHGDSKSVSCLIVWYCHAIFSWRVVLCRIARAGSCYLTKVKIFIEVKTLSGSWCLLLVNISK